MNIKTQLFDVDGMVLGPNWFSVLSNRDSSIQSLLPLVHDASSYTPSIYNEKGRTNMSSPGALHQSVMALSNGVGHLIR